MFTLERIIGILGAIAGVTGFIIAYSHLFFRVSVRNIRRNVRQTLSKMAKDSFKPELLVCLGRGGFFVGALFTDEMDRKVPLLGIDKSYYRVSDKGSRTRRSKIDVPESLVLPEEIAESNTLLITGEIVHGESMEVAINYLKSHIPGCKLKTFSLFYSIDSSFEPEYIGCKIRGRKRRLPWKKEVAPSHADYLPARNGG